MKLLASAIAASIIPFIAAAPAIAQYFPEDLCSDEHIGIPGPVAWVKWTNGWCLVFEEYRPTFRGSDRFKQNYWAITLTDKDVVVSILKGFSSASDYASESILYVSSATEQGEYGVPGFPMGDNLISVVHDDQHGILTINEGSSSEIASYNTLFEQGFSLIDQYRIPSPTRPF